MNIKKIILYILLLLLAPNVTVAKEPKKVGATKKSVASILVYKEGKLLRNGVGVYSGAGELLSSYSLFIDADSAVAITPDGKSRKVQRIIGANDIYDCIKLRTNSDKKQQHLQLTTAAATIGETLYLVSYGVKNSATIEQIAVNEVSKSGGVEYYTFSFPMQERYISAPVVNANGELVALMQPSASGDTINSYAVSASLADNLTTTSLSYGSSMFSKINIPVALPPNQKDALTTLYLLQGYAHTDMSEKFIKPLDEFLSLYPESYEGYLMRAEYIALADSAFERAHIEWNKALKITNKPDDVHYNISKVYTTMLTRAASKEEQTVLLDSAIANINKAININPEALYIQHSAELLYAKGDYAASFEHYIRLSQTNMGGTNAFVAASRCKEMLEEWDAAIAYMDSAVNSFGNDSLTAAPYIINRAMLKERAKRYREAVVDYNTYASLRNGELNANFYYCREQAEYNAKMYKQALDDIEMALYLQPDELLFLIEKGRLCYRVKYTDEAIAALTRATEIANDNPDAYYMLARCYMVKGDKTAAKKNMLRAKELGHFDADTRLQEIEATK